MHVIDIGNSKTKVAVFEGETVSKREVFDTDKCLLHDFWEGEVFKKTPIDRVAFSSVVPEVSNVVRSFLDKQGVIPFDIRTAGDKILKIDYDIAQLGTDRLANAVAAYRRYPPPLLVVDFGTATTYNIVREDGTFAGGIIAPGIKTCIDFLVENSGLLIPIELKRPKEFLGHTTEGSLLSGYYFTYIGQLREIIKRTVAEIGEEVRIIGTGGLVDFAKVDFPDIIVDRDLTLHGIRLLYEENCGK
jgi:type III pantothenate kinase